MQYCELTTRIALFDLLTLTCEEDILGHGQHTGLRHSL